MSSELLFVVLLVLANGVFSMSEIAVVSARKARLQQRAEAGDAQAAEALALANEPTRFLSTVQIGITLVGILAGAFGGATIAEPLALALRRFPALAPYREALALALVVAGIAYLQLVVGELVPKRLGLNHPERIAATIARPMRLLSVAAAPVVALLSLSTEAILRLLRVRPSEEPPVTTEEIGVLMEQGTQAGVFQEAEQDMVGRVFRLNDRRVSALMTPRRAIVWLNLDDPLDCHREQIIECPYSRFPVGRSSLDDVVGIVHAKHLLAHELSGHTMDLAAQMQEPLCVPESTPVLRLLDLFKESGTHIALVLDEFGTIQGLVTLNDVLQAIVGDMPKAGATDEPQIVEREDGSWLLDGLLPIERFQEQFALATLPAEDEGQYQTVGGFVITRLGRLPAATDTFTWNGLCFEVMDMDGHRVDKVLVAAIQPEVTSDE